MKRFLLRILYAILRRRHHSLPPPPPRRGRGGTAGVREPRKPSPLAGAGAAAVPLDE